MTDIKKILKQEYEVLSKQYTVLGVFLCGSQNYGLNTEESDIDTKVIVAPSLRDLILGSPASKTIKFDCGECDIKDIREIVNNYKKQNVNYIETLFTDYHFVSPGFKFAYDELIAHREKLAHMDERRAVRSLAGQVEQTYKRMLTKTDKTAKDIKKYGYHRKSLMNCFKTAAMLDKYISGEKYEAVLDCSKYAQIRNTVFPAPKAAQIAGELAQRAKAMADTYIKERDPQPDEALAAWLDDWLFDLIRCYVTY